MTSTSLADVVQHELGSGGRLKIKGVDGRVDLVAVDGTVAVVHGSGERPLKDDFRIGTAPGELTLSATGTDGPLGGFRLGRRGCQAIRVEVPHGTRVSVVTASGSIRADGLDADQRYRSVSGDVVVDGNGGRMDIDTVSGDVRVVSTSELELDVRTVSGDLVVSAPVLRSLKAKSMSGAMGIDGGFAATGEHRLDTISGDVRIVPHGPIRVDGTTVSGDVRSPLAHRSSGLPGRRSIELGTGGPLVAYRSISGDLEIAAQGATTDGPAASSDDSDRRHLESARLAILRELETGAIDVAEAERRLAAVEGAIPGGSSSAPPPPARPNGGADLGWARRV